MKTTAAIVEMLAIGFVSSIWLFLLVFHFRPELFSIPQAGQTDNGAAVRVSDLKDWALPVSVALSLLWYYMGWIVNGVCFLAADKSRFNREKARVALRFGGRDVQDYLDADDVKKLQEAKTKEEKKKVEDAILKEKDKKKSLKGLYEKMRARVYQDASPSFLAELDVDRASMRIARTGVLNFSLIGVVLFCYVGFSPWLILPFAFAAGSIVEALRKGKRFYHEIGNTYRYIIDRSSRRRVANRVICCST